MASVFMRLYRACEYGWKYKDDLYESLGQDRILEHGYGVLLLKQGDYRKGEWINAFRHDRQGFCIMRHKDITAAWWTKNRRECG